MSDLRMFTRLEGPLGIEMFKVPGGYHVQLKKWKVVIASHSVVTADERVAWAEGLGVMAGYLERCVQIARQKAKS